MRASRLLWVPGLLTWAMLGAALADGGAFDTLVTLSVEDAPLKEVAKILSQEAQITIVPHKDVLETPITISLNETPVRQALEAIAKAYDLVIEPQPGTKMYFITTAGGRADGKVIDVGGGVSGGIAGATVVPVRPEVVLPAATRVETPRPTAARDVRLPHSGDTRPTTRVGATKKVTEKIQLKFLQASVVASWYGMPSIGPDINGAQRRYQAPLNVPTSSVALGDTINRHDRFVSRARGKATVDPRMFYANGVYPYARDQFGDEAGVGGGGQVGGGGLGGGPGGGGIGGIGGQQQAVFPMPEGVESIVGYDLISALIVTGEPDGIEALRELIALLDLPPLQIEVEARFVTLSVNDADGLGIVWSVTDGSSAVSGSTPSGGGASIAFRTSTGNFQTLITAVLRENKGKVVNAPKIATQNGQPAQIAFSQTVPVTISSTVVTDASTTTSTDIDTIDVTTALIVVPRVTGQPPNESVTTVIQPQLEDIIGFVDNPSGGTIPITASQQISTLLRVPNGETIALGGLIRKNNSESSQKIPLLSSLPFIGSLFRSRTHNVDESELLIFITPTIMREVGAPGPSLLR